ncbi:MAG: glucose-6-phosphate isomerase, partial [Chitinophagaceae bacterium]
MFPTINPVNTKAWKALDVHFSKNMCSMHLRSLFEQDPERFRKFSIKSGDLLFDYSKNIITTETLETLFQLARETKLPEAIEAMFSGEAINATENRSVLHTALRNCFDKPVLLEGRDIMPDIRSVLEQMKKCCADIHSGKWLGFSGKKIKYIVNIGIGGSDLGPVMVTEALRPYWKEG